MVNTSWVDSMFVTYDFPELCTDLVTALTSLQMNDFTHILKNMFFNLKTIEEKRRCGIQRRRFRTFLARRLSNVQRVKSFALF
jgi:hypothetical protein